MAFAFLFSCDLQNPVAPERINPFDEYNPEFEGDPYDLSVRLQKKLDRFFKN